MNFRCGIPVIIMGETGCGKTRLIRFMCDLQKPAGVEMNNMVLMKVGTEKIVLKRLPFRPWLKMILPCTV